MPAKCRVSRRFSEDGSYVYFVAKRELASNENADKLKAVGGQPNLYLYHEGTVTFIATLSPNDDLSGEENKRFSRLSADGTHLAFISERKLTEYDNQPVENLHGCGPEGCREVYLFDASTGSLVCASCDPSGARPLGAAGFGESPNLESYYVPRNLSADGSRLFFNSLDPLLPQAGNGLQNVVPSTSKGTST